MLGKKLFVIIFKIIFIKVKAWNYFCETNIFTGTNNFNSQNLSWLNLKGNSQYFFTNILIRIIDLDIVVIVFSVTYTSISLQFQ
jgi:hypothetical protein